MPSQNKYNPLRIPYSVAGAQDHRCATSSGLPIQSSPRCSCCLLPIQQTPLPINFDKEHLKHLGAQYRFFYDYCKIVGVLLILVMFDSGVSQFQDAFKSRSQVSTIFGVNWSSLSPLYPEDKFFLYSCLSFVSIAFFIFLAKIFIQYRIDTEKTENPGQQCWSILLRNVPKTQRVQEKIRDLFKMNFSNIQIRQVILISSMEKYIQAQNLIKNQVRQWKQLLKTEQKKKQQILCVLKKIQSCTQNFNKIKQQLQTSKNDNFSQSAIIVFESRQNQQQVLKAWKNNFFTKNKLQASFGELNLNDRQIIMAEAAPTPSQIYWYNICKPYSQNHANRRLNYILLFFIYVCFYLILFSAELCTGRKIKQKYTDTYAIIPIMVVLSILSYTLLPYIVYLLQIRQGPISQTINYQSTIVKLALSFVMLRSFVILAVQSTFTTGPQVAYSTVNKIFILLVSDVVVSTLLWLINPQDIVKRIQKLFIGKRNNLTQQQANKMYRRPTHNLPYKYSAVLSGFWTAIMLCNLIPIAVAAIFVGLVVLYWIDKLNLARRSRVDSNKRISQNFVRFFVQLMPIALILKPLSNLILWSTAKQFVAVPEVIMLVLGIAYNIIPNQKLITKVLSLIRYEIKKVEYNYNEGAMDTLYRLQNPITGSLEQKIAFLEGTKNQKVIIGDNHSHLSHMNMSATNTIKEKIIINSQPMSHNIPQLPQQNRIGPTQGQNVQGDNCYATAGNCEVVQDTDRNMVL